MQQLYQRMTWIRTMALAVAMAPVAQAWSQPAHEGAAPPLRMVVPYPAGGTTDYVARLLQKKLTEVLGRSVIVDNRAGASGTIGTDLVAKAKPDGNTIVFGNQGPNAILPLLRPTPYDPLRDLTPVTTVAFMPMVLLTKGDNGLTNLDEFLAAAKAPGASFNYGSSGLGSFAHLTADEMARKAGLRMTHIPYQGGAQAAAALLQGDIQMSFVSGLESASLVASGKARILAVSSGRRVPTLPGIPAIAEKVPGFESTLWFAVFAPKGTPDAVAAPLRQALVQAIESPEFVAYLHERHSQARASTPQELGDLVRRDMQHWRSMITAGDIKLN